MFTAKDIFDQDFKVAVRGYNKMEVDEFLDEVIKDYETYAALVKELREENARLKEELEGKAPGVSPSPSPVQPEELTPAPDLMSDTAKLAAVGATNFDILKRLNRLEKEVFGKQIVEEDLL